MNLQMKIYQLLREHSLASVEAEKPPMSYSEAVDQLPQYGENEGAVRAHIRQEWETRQSAVSNIESEIIELLGLHEEPVTDIIGGAK